MFIVDDGKGGLRALATGDEIYFRDAVGGLRADTAYYAIVGADGSIRLAATLADAMLYQTGAGQNDALLALYPGMGKAVTVDFKATDLASAQAYVRNYVQKTDAPAQTADEIALYGSSYRTGYFFYFGGDAAQYREQPAVSGVRHHQRKGLRYRQPVRRRAAGGSLPECEGGAGHHAAHLGAGLDRRAAGRIHAEAARPEHDQRRPARQHLRRAAGGRQGHPVARQCRQPGGRLSHAVPLCRARRHGLAGPRPRGFHRRQPVAGGQSHVLERCRAAARRQAGGGHRTAIPVRRPLRPVREQPRGLRLQQPDAGRRDRRTAGAAAGEHRRGPDRRPAGGGHRQRLPGPGLEGRRRAIRGAGRRQRAAAEDGRAGGRHARSALSHHQPDPLAGGAGGRRRGVGL